MKAGNIPSRFERENGELFRGGYQNRFDLHHQDGWREEKIPPFDPVLQVLGEPYYDAVLDKVTYPVLEIELPSLEQAKANRISELKNAVKDLYHSIQWYLEMKRMSEEEIPVLVKEKILQIRNKYEQTKAQINALTTVAEIYNYELPYDVISKIQQQFDNVD